MAKVSVLIPSRNESYLARTVSDVLSKSSDTECVVVLEDHGKPSITPTPDEWAKVQTEHGPRLTTIYHHDAKGMRPSLNEAAASAISRGAKYLLKLDAHCKLEDGWDVVLKSECDKDWVVVPRRDRLDPVNWMLQDSGKPPIDYHYLSFPDDPKDFGGKSLNGKPWTERAKQRLDILLDDEMSSQGSCWFMHADYFQFLELMDHANYGQFWSEFQEIGLKCWLSGGQVKVNKKTTYLHWHKGKSGRGYRMPESWLTQGASFSKEWIFNDARFEHKQTRPFEWLIDHFWPVPTWPADWCGVLYRDRKPRLVGNAEAKEVVHDGEKALDTPSLRILSAFYGLSPRADNALDVTEKVRSLVQGNTLDLVVGNTTLGVGNPFRGQKKQLRVVYSWGDGEELEKLTDERDWLIIGQSERWVEQVREQEPFITVNADVFVSGEGLPECQFSERVNKMMKSGSIAMLTVPALNDFLIRKFQIPSHRLRGPMPIELRDFHRDDLATLFAELGFNKGAEIGVAEGKYSEVLLKANPELELLCVDPWGRSEGNPQQKTTAKHDFARSETARRIQGTKAQMIAKTSMRAVEDVDNESLDFVYLDANHSYDYFMEDLINWSRKVRKGGIIAGDDAYRLDPKRWGAGPMEGIYDYTRAHSIEPWFLINAHKSVDFFFVKP